jgi:Domain of unknown function (DUF397)
MDGAVWRKASYSNGHSACVEVAAMPRGLVAVRDSRRQDRACVLITTDAWQRFTGAVRAGEQYPGWPPR